MQTSHEQDAIPPVRGKLSRARRIALVLCLTPLLLVCAGAGALAVGLRDGPVALQLPGGSLLKLGSDNFVLSNYSFQNGSTYFADLSGSGARNILEVHWLNDTHHLEIVLNHSTKDEKSESHLVDLSLP